ncbi:MAG: group III truncated hemoglobin [Bacteroidota bacterium]|nr:group III truncated hemoglobin [Bacteroidota bacterium]MDP4216567.1 group III truncated hemoglobin [Bacteroidota bacterium]MDP4245031.1 group III truncated hemoglobin [Bacteroidota bacterium]MDP4252866.1 group III truncated hemoglobin [Bacteroidota bacterium]MDP4259858.1 group III truncated hemoglobin [Bacteroidota bacterium]
MKKDIEGRKEICQLVDAFYEKVRKDASIGFIFNDIAQVDWVHHLPVMYDFWENVLFQTGHYTGNPMVTHTQLHQKFPLTGEHFAQWKKLFLETIEEHFEGPNADLARQRALSIAGVMERKIVGNFPGL